MKKQTRKAISNKPNVKEPEPAASRNLAEELLMKIISNPFLPVPDSSPVQPSAPTASKQSSKKKQKPKAKEFGMDYRPETYWDLDQGRPAHPDSSAIYWGGNEDEYLPDYEEGEVEIACIHLESTTGDKISVRAKPAGRRIAYSIKDEYGTVFKFKPKTSTQPLTMQELINLINTADGYGEGETGLTNSFRDMNFAETGDLGLVDFVYVTSEFYSELTDYYDQEAQDWLKRVSGENE